MTAQQSSTPENVVFIGSNRPPMNYVLAVVTQLNNPTNTAILKARGRAISTAVDVAEMVRNKFVEKCTVTKVQIGTEKITPEGGKRPFNVSMIEIHLTRQMGA